MISQQSKYQELTGLLRPKLAEGLIVAFSGGVDSAFLLWAAEQTRQRHGGRLLAITAVSASLAQVEKEDARLFAETLGVEHVIEPSAEFSNQEYLSNDGNRCFHCKTELFRLSGTLGQRRGYKWIAYGYNASDRSDFRPGHTAALENNVLSPLNDANLTKEDIRALMRLNNLDLADKPASPCLSSRLMTGVQITPKKLKDVEEMEVLLRRGGLNVFRVRLHEDGDSRFLRLEVAPDELFRAMEMRDELVRLGQRLGYRWVTLDLAGYRTGGGNL
ncbi:MAG TPA: ATP-dependent sacrificial sulfur transferase LarE [Pyrinomonadaceae bacterium]|nr:ATP-dependent sacrificial sulfur transferase LarE [Pyrinomonadaceae bacterium]